MHHCEECGSELPTDARFCGLCGQSISSETEVAANSGDAPVVDVPLSPPDTSAADAAGEVAPPHHPEGAINLAPTDAASLRSPGMDGASPAVSTALSESQNPASENGEEEEQQTPHDNLGSTSSLPRDLDGEPGKSESQFIAEHPQHNQTPSGKLEARRPTGPAPRQGLRSVPKLLLILLTVLIVVAGGATALIGLFHGHLPGTGVASNALLSSSFSETVRTAGPSLTASICASSSTPSPSGTNDGIGLTLSSASGCSSFIAATATSLCLVFPYNSGAFHRYIFDISNATVDSKAYHLVLSIAEYTGPATYNDAVHVTVGIGESSTGRNISWVYRSGNVSINSDEQSGTMDVILESASSGNTIHVVGGWTCGRLIKNT